MTLFKLIKLLLIALMLTSVFSMAYLVYMDMIVAALIPPGFIVICMVLYAEVNAWGDW